MLSSDHIIIIFPKILYRKGSLNIDISVGIEDTANAISDLTLAISFLGQETFIVLNQQATVSSITMDGAVGELNVNSRARENIETSLITMNSTSLTKKKNKQKKIFAMEICIMTKYKELCLHFLHT